MAAISAAGRKLIESGKLAHLVTLNRDGSPQVSCVWAGFDGDDLVLASIGPRQKLRNIARDPRVVLSFETGKIGRMGLAEYMVIHGHARLEAGGAPELLQRLAHVY